MNRANRLLPIADALPVAVAFAAEIALGSLGQQQGEASASDTSTPSTALKELVDHWGVLPPKPVTP